MPKLIDTVDRQLFELAGLDPEMTVADFLRENVANGRYLPDNTGPFLRQGPPAGVHTSAQLRLQRVVLNADGTEAYRREWRKNLILDAGLDLVASYMWAACTQYCHVGTGTNPFQRDSGTTTISVTALVATASAGYFEAADVGRLLKLDSGEEYYISGYTDTTHVSLLAGPDAAASEGTVWYVNRTTLQTEVQRTSTCRTSTGDNQTTYDGALRRFTHRRSHLFPTEVGPVTYQEIGWGPTNTTALFSGLVLSGGGDALVAGQQYLVISELIMTPTPTTSTAQSNVGSGGWDSTGNICIEDYAPGLGGRVFSEVTSTGGVSGGSNACCEPSQSGNVILCAIQANFTLISPMGSSTLTRNGTAKAVGLSSYSIGNFYRDKSVGFTVSEANYTWYGVSLCWGTPGTSASCNLTCKFTTPQVKDNTHTVTASFRFSWGRTLIN